MRFWEPNSAVNHFMALYGFPAQVIAALVLQAFMFTATPSLSRVRKRRRYVIWAGVVTGISLIAAPIAGVIALQLI